MIKVRLIPIAAIIGLGLIGCKESDPHAGHDHGGHEDHSGHESHGGHAHDLSETVWSDKTELFVQYKPLVTAKEAKFTAHVTVLNGYLPYSGVLNYNILIHIVMNCKLGTVRLNIQ